MFYNYINRFKYLEEYILSHHTQHVKFFFEFQQDPWQQMEELQQKIHINKHLFFFFYNFINIFFIYLVL